MWTSLFYAGKQDEEANLHTPLSSWARSMADLATREPSSQKNCIIVPATHNDAVPSILFLYGGRDYRSRPSTTGQWSLPYTSFMIWASVILSFSRSEARK